MEVANEYSTSPEVRVVQPYLGYCMYRPGVQFLFVLSLVENRHRYAAAMTVVAEQAYSWAQYVEQDLNKS